jgi:uncharacterized membrane protein YjjB (DUF3815 family)
MSNVNPAPVANKPYKAIAAFVITFIGTLWANLNGRTDFNTMTFADWMTVVVPTILATAAVYGISNRA